MKSSKINRIQSVKLASNKSCSMSSNTTQDFSRNSSQGTLYNNEKNKPNLQVIKVNNLSKLNNYNSLKVTKINNLITVNKNLNNSISKISLNDTDSLIKNIKKTSIVESPIKIRTSSALPIKNRTNTLNNNEKKMAFNSLKIQIEENSNKTNDQNTKYGTNCNNTNDIPFDNLNYNSPQNIKCLENNTLNYDHQLNSQLSVQEHNKYIFNYNNTRNNYIEIMKEFYDKIFIVKNPKNKNFISNNGNLSQFLIDSNKSLKTKGYECQKKILITEYDIKRLLKDYYGKCFIFDMKIKLNGKFDNAESMFSSLSGNGVIKMQIVSKNNQNKIYYHLLLTNLGENKYFINISLLKFQNYEGKLFLSVLNKLIYDREEFLIQIEQVIYRRVKFFIDFCNVEFKFALIN